MFSRLRVVLLSSCLVLSINVAAQEHHDHPAPERLGKVSFPTSCTPAVQKSFVRAVALLHSFAYSASEKTFRQVAAQDPNCAMAHWGIAMTHFHQLWDPPIVPSALPVAEKEVEQAKQLKASDRERQYINALAELFRDSANTPFRTRAESYEKAMKAVAAANPNDLEAQVFYALAVLANAPPTDKTHAKQKQAAEFLEPLYKKNPQHPGMAHYLIHAYDNAELAKRGLSAAREYSKIAPSAPHALHMPSHIFTRLGYWNDSIASNLAARRAAEEQGDIGEALHAMDYLVYAYLQAGRDQEAADIIHQIEGMKDLKVGEFKVGYAFTAMPIRYIAERNRWSDAVKVTPVPGAAPHVAATAIWARGMGFARTGDAAKARQETAKLRELESQLRSEGKDYWATQTGILAREVEAWALDAEGNAEKAVATLREAADQEDAIEKLPVTPGPIIPAREQLGDLLLKQKRRDQASAEFKRALADSPGRRNAMQGAKNAAAPEVTEGASAVSR